MPQPIVALIAEASRAGVTIVVSDGTLTVSGPARAAALGRELVARKPEVFAYLAASHWDGTAAVRLMEAADAAVERHGCRGADPRVQDAAAQACEAYRRRDTGALARACAEVARLAASDRGRRTTGPAEGSSEDRGPVDDGGG